MKLESGQYYYDFVNHAWLQFCEERNGYYWFYVLEEDGYKTGRHAAYYEEELTNIREY
jgi:hypothetical protein